MNISERAKHCCMYLGFDEKTSVEIVGLAVNDPDNVALKDYWDTPMESHNAEFIVVMLLLVKNAALKYIELQFKKLFET